MKFQYNGRDFYIHKQLAMQLDSLVYNLKDDWDFVIIITGDRMVRVGKSVLAQIVCAYLGYRIGMVVSKEVKYELKDIYFDHKEMLKEARKKPRFSVVHYDEGREGFAAIKAMTKVQKDLMDFLNESGQLNHILVVVLPDYFDLVEQMAVARSEILINVYRSEEKRMLNVYGEGKIPIVKFKRGRFEFFSRYSKAKLYDEYRKKRRKSYGMIRCDFLGDFYNHYAVDEQEYRDKKLEALKRLSESKEVTKSHKADVIRDKIILELHKEGNNYPQIAEILMEKYEYKLDHSQVGRIVRQYREKPLLKGGINE